MSSQSPNLALVLSGGGARGAYEAGVLHYIRTMMPDEVSKRKRFDIICGSSIGAINACHLAATSHDLIYQGRRIYQLWQDVKQDSIYRRDVLSFFSLLSRSFFGISRNLFSSVNDDAVPTNHKKHFKGLLDTSPLIPFLNKNVPWKQISVNINNGLLKALSITGTNVYTGKPELFVEKHPDVTYTGRYVLHDTKIEAHHAMASAALPMIFKSVPVKGQYYMDGSLRMNTPMSPAIQLGAERILVIGLHHRDEINMSPVMPQENRVSREPPSIGLMLGKILSSIFLDKLDYDLEQMGRINRVIDWGKGCFGDDFLDRINRYLALNNINGDIATRGLKKLSAFSVFPSQDIRSIFAECIEGQQFFSTKLNRFERTLLKVLDVDLHSGVDFLSFITFHPIYIKRLLELGFEDARSQHDQILAYLLSE